MEVEEILKQNIDSYLLEYKINNKILAKEMNVNVSEIEELINEPLQKSDLLFLFLENKKLSFVDFSSNLIKREKTHSFRKSAEHNIDFNIIKNFQQISAILREEEIINNIDINYPSYCDLFDEELMDKLFIDLNLKNYFNEFAQNREVYNTTKIFQSLIDYIYEVYKLRIILIDNKNIKFNGLYLNKPLATVILNVNIPNYATMLFTLFHEIYHFLQDNGSNGEEIDIWDNKSGEDIRANKFSAEIFRKNMNSKELNNLNTKNNIEVTSFMKKHSISKSALGILIKQKLTHIKPNNIHKCHFNIKPSKDLVINALNKQLQNAQISHSVYRKLYSLLAKRGALI